MNNLDNYNELINQGINIFGSREKIRLQMIDYAKKYLELGTVDFYKTSVVSYLIDSMSILTASHLFYDSVIYREFFMVEAQMQESVYNLARWIGYKPPYAVPSTVDIMFTIPLTFSAPLVNFTIPSNFKAWAGQVPFLVETNTETVPAAKFNYSKAALEKYVNENAEEISAANGKIINNQAISVRDSYGYHRPIYLDKTGRKASFVLPFRQLEKVTIQFLVPESLLPYQFYSNLLKFKGMVSTMKVYVAEPQKGDHLRLDETSPNDFDPRKEITGTKGNNYKWQEWSESEHGLYTMYSTAREYVLIGGTDKAEIYFGNGIVGKQPAPGSAVTAIIYVTKGSQGNVIPYSIVNSDQLFYTNTAIASGEQTQSTNTTKLFQIDFVLTNPVQSSGGSDIPTLPEIKRNAIVNLRSKGKLVSDLDYDDINVIMGPNFPSVEAFPILKRSDIKINEIMAFIRLLYHDEYFLPQIVPTRNVKLPVFRPSFDSKGRYTIYRGTKTADDYYETLYNITIDNVKMMAYYDYVLQNLKGNPTFLYEESNDTVNTQFSYIPISGVDFDVDLTSAIDLETSSSSSDPVGHIFPLMIKVNLNHIPVDSIPSESPVEMADAVISEFRCRMITKWADNTEYDYLSSGYMVEKELNTETGVYTYKSFTFKIPNYLEVPTEVQRFEFFIECYAPVLDPITFEPVYETSPSGPIIKYSWQPLSSYYTDVVVRRDLSDMMLSSVTKTTYWDGAEHDYEKYEIHNTPVILSSYLDDGAGGGVFNRVDNQQYPNFEITVMQKMFKAENLEQVRMTTDFINIKYPDTYGNLNNLKYNPVEYIIESRYHTPFATENPPNIIFGEDIPDLPSSSSSGGGVLPVIRYIVNGQVPGYESKQLSSYIDHIAEWFGGIGDSGVWYLVPPRRGMYVRIKDELDSNGDLKVVVYDGDHWKDVQEYEIPLKIRARIDIDPRVTSTSDKIITDIKANLMNHFLQSMGIQKKMDRSEITAVIRETPGVIFCDLLEPEIDIRFDYELHDLTQLQLLDYTPQYVGFNEDTIELLIGKHE